MIIANKPEVKRHEYTDAELKIMMAGGRVDPDAELCQRLAEEHRQGIVRAHVIKNIYGWCLFQHYNGGHRISEIFSTKEKALEYAYSWEAANPEKNHLILWLC